MTVLYYEKKKESQGEYISSLIIVQIFAIALLFLLASFVSIMLLIFNVINRFEMTIIIAASVATVGFLAWEFIRSLYFMQALPKKVISIDVVYSVLLFAISLVIYFVYHINITIIFFIIGFCSFSISFIKVKPFFKRINYSIIREYIKQNWFHGKWALSGVIVYHLQSYSYIYLIGLLISSVAIADVSAARLLMMPFLFLSTGWRRISLPYGSQLREENKINLFFKQQLVVGVLFAIGIIIYTAVILFTPESWKNVILTKSYQSSYDYLIYFGILYLIGAFTNTASQGLQVLKKFSIITKIHFVTMILVIVSSYILINQIGIKGGLIALISGQLILAIGLWFNFTKSKSNYTSIQKNSDYMKVYS